MRLVDILKMQPGVEKVKKLAVDGLLNDAGNHKQWYLERILEALGCDLMKVRQELQADDYDWEDGTAP